MTESSATCVRTDDISGWKRVTLENAALKVAVLPEKGGDIYEFIDKRTGSDILFKSPTGLRPASDECRSDLDTPFLRNYEGGWQELFPSLREASSYRGRTIPFHGEVALRPWECSSQQTHDGPSIRLEILCESVPLRLTRTMRLEENSATLVLDETVSSESNKVEQFVWGHHCVVGPPLLAEGAEFDCRATTIVTDDQPVEPTARFRPGSRTAWPLVPDREGGEIDLRLISGPATRSHDHCLLSGLDEGWLTVRNPRLGLRFELSWDANVFPWVRLWQAFGGVTTAPLEGSYALGIEPWSATHGLASALASGEASVILPGATINTALRASLLSP